MKRILLFLQVITISAAVAAQPMMKISEPEHNFGIFKEEAGPQKYDFVVINSGSSPLVIQNIVASCGCTTPEWTKQPIAAGEKGRITAIYDPKNRPGKFSKTLTVYSNSKPEVQVLQIKGEVIARERTIEELYTFPVGPVRFESINLAFTNIKKTEKKIRIMNLINTSNEPVKVEFDNVPAHLALKTSPETLKPGQKGYVEGTYDASKNSAWGNVNDPVRIKINGKVQEDAWYYVSANLVEDFSSMSREDLEKAPVFNILKTTADLGKMEGATTGEVEFKFTNSGKSDLIIRHVQSTCGCTAVQGGLAGVPIKPGQSSSIKAVFNSGSYRGKVTKTIYVYTNDPKRSEAALTLVADVQSPVATK